MSGGDLLMVPDGLSFAYKVFFLSTGITHQWELTGSRGGIHVSASFSDRESMFSQTHWTGGIEGHSPIQGEYRSEKPDHDHCWLLDKPCWHDGSSLQFSEQIAPYLPHENRQMGALEHADVLATMLSRYRSWLPTEEQISAASQPVPQAEAQHPTRVEAVAGDEGETR